MPQCLKPECAVQCLCAGRLLCRALFLVLAMVLVASLIVGVAHLRRAGTSAAVSEAAPLARPDLPELVAEAENH